MASIGITTKVSNVGEGDQILSPISGRKMLVRSVESAPFGMRDLHCLDGSGDRQVLTLHADEDILVLDEA